MSQSQTVEAMIALTVSDDPETPDSAQDQESNQELWAIETPEIEIKPDYSELLAQCQTWFEQRQHQKIADSIEAIDESKRTAELNCELGRAYNNIAKPGDKPAFQKALNCLKPLEKTLKDDFRWNYRIAYTYFHLEQEWLALRYFQQALQIRNHDQDTIQFIHKCFSALGAPEFVHNFASRVDRMWEQFALEEADWCNQLDQNQNTSEVFAKINELVSKVLEHPRLDLAVTHTDSGDKFVLTFELCNTSTFVYAMNYIVARAPKILHRRWQFNVGHPKSNYQSFNQDRLGHVSADKIYVKILDSKNMEKITSLQDAAAKMPHFQGEMHDDRDDKVTLDGVLEPAQKRPHHELAANDNSANVNDPSTDLPAKPAKTIAAAKIDSFADTSDDVSTETSELQDQVCPLSTQDLIELGIIKQDASESSKLLDKAAPADADKKAVSAEEKAEKLNELRAYISKELARFEEQINESLNNTDTDKPYVPQLITPPQRTKYSVCLYCDEMSRLLKENYQHSTPEIREKIQNLVKRIMLITNRIVGECTAFTAFASFRFTGEKRQFDEIPAPIMTLDELDSAIHKRGFKLNMTSGELLKDYVMQPYWLKPNSNPQEPKLRQEIFSGWSILPQLCNEYILDDTSLINLYHQHGITMGFVSYEFAPWNYPDRQISVQRNNLQKKIISFINRHPMCMVTGGAFGLYHDYVDFICFGDVRAVQRELYAWCSREQDTPMMIYSPFRFAPVTIIYDAAAEAAKATMREVPQQHLEHTAQQQGEPPSMPATAATAPAEPAATAQATVESESASEVSEATNSTGATKNSEGEPISAPTAESAAQSPKIQELKLALKAGGNGEQHSMPLNDHEVTKTKVRHEVQFHPSAELKSALNLFTLEEEAKLEKDHALAQQELQEAGFPVITEPKGLEAELLEPSEVVANSQEAALQDGKLSGRPQNKSGQCDKKELPSIVVKE